MFATGAGSFLIGDVSGDVLTASAFGGDGLVAGAGNETLNGGSSRWENVMFGGSGSDTVMLGAGQDTYVGGSGSATIQMGSGSAALFAGTGAEVFDFTASLTDPNSSLGTGVPGSNFIGGFRVGIDRLDLAGGLAVTSYASGPGMTSLKLSDGTQIHLAGVSGVPQASLFG
jgi:Ca2+-binding RTX toxin-like protein